MIRSRVRPAGAGLVAASLLSAPSPASPPAAEPFPRRLHPWRTTDDVVEGWDWSLPPGVLPADRSGVAFFGTAPPGYAGRRLELLTWSWARLEPQEGEYDFEPLRREIEREFLNHLDD